MTLATYILQVSKYLDQGNQKTNSQMGFSHFQSGYFIFSFTNPSIDSFIQLVCIIFLLCTKC